VALACLMIPESSSRWWARRRYRFLNPFKLLRTMSANKPDVCSMAILGSLYLNWRYLPCIRPMQGLCRRICLQNMALQYLRFRVLKFPVNNLLSYNPIITYESSGCFLIHIWFNHLNELGMS
jgi:hypothetical protein